MAFRRSTGLRNKLLGINTNILTNSTFETSTSGWSGTNATLASVTSGVDGGNCASITNSTTSAGKMYQDINVKVGREYRFEGNVKAGASNVILKIGNATTPNKYFESDTVTTTGSFVSFKEYLEAQDSTIRFTVENVSTTSSDESYADEMYLYDEASSIKEIFKNSKIKIYSGTQPSSANDAPTGTLLVTISLNGTGDGISFGEASSGSISKDPNEVWSGTSVATGTAGYFRLHSQGDTESLSENDERIDGAIATSGAELNMSNTAIQSGAVQTISVFDVSISA